MKTLSSIFFAGLAALLPIIGTFYLISWLVVSVETMLGKTVKTFFGEQYYVPGLGIVLAIVVTFLVGLFMRFWLAKIMFGFWERMLYRLPLIKTVYGIFQDFTQYVTGSSTPRDQQVVTVQLPGTNIQLLGFVTRSDMSRLPKGLASAERIAVYLPMSYQIGGYTVMIPRDEVTPVDMPMDDAMRFAVTAGLSMKASNKD